MFNVSRRGWFRGLCGAVVGLVAGRRVGGATASEGTGGLGGVPDPAVSQAKPSGSGPRILQTTYIYDARVSRYTIGEPLVSRTSFTYDGPGACKLPVVGEVTTFTYHAPAQRV